MILKSIDIINQEAVFEIFVTLKLLLSKMNILNAAYLQNNKRQKVTSNSMLLLYFNSQDKGSPPQLRPARLIYELYFRVDLLTGSKFLQPESSPY